MIDVGVRRWRTFDRRNKRRWPTRDDRVEDLAVGLHARFEPAGVGRGPEMQDYRCVARAIADGVDPTSEDDAPAC